MDYSLPSSQEQYSQPSVGSGGAEPAWDDPDTFNVKPPSLPLSFSLARSLAHPLRLSVSQDLTFGLGSATLGAGDLPSLCLTRSAEHALSSATQCAMALSLSVCPSSVEPDCWALLPSLSLSLSACTHAEDSESSWAANNSRLVSQWSQEREQLQQRETQGQWAGEKLDPLQPGWAPAEVAAAVERSLSLYLSSLSIPHPLTRQAMVATGAETGREARPFKPCRQASKRRAQRRCHSGISWGISVCSLSLSLSSLRVCVCVCHCMLCLRQGGTLGWG